MDDASKKAKSAASGNGAPSEPRRPARAELVWEGKYDAVRRLALPFQTVETVNESAQDRQRNLQFGPGFREEEWRNRLIWGDKKYVLPSLLPEFAGKVNLIYIDPPFDTGADFSFTATVPDDPESEEATRSPSRKSPASLSRKHIVTHGDVASNRICSGSMKPPFYCMNFFTRLAALTYTLDHG